MRRLVAFLVVLVTLTSVIITGAAVVAQDGGGDQPTLDDLRRGGQQVSGEDPPPSVRLIGDGAVTVEYTPARPFAETTRLEPGTRLETNTIRLRSSWFGEDPLDVTVHVAYWQAGSRTVTGENGTTTTEEYAANVSTHTAQAQFPRGYSTTAVRLRPHYDTEYEVTIWLTTTDGEPIEGARWRASHRSNPAYSPATDVNSRGDLWTWGFMVFVLPGVPGILIGGYSARSILQKTITGPRKGPLWWLGTSVLALIAVGFVVYYQAAVILSVAPWLAGLALAAIAVVVYIEAFDADVEEAEFRKKNVYDAISPGRAPDPVSDLPRENGHPVTADDADDDAATDADDDERDVLNSKDRRFEKIADVDVIRRNGQLYMPKRGLRPFIARYFADPAVVPVDDLNLVIEAEGDRDKVFEVDPEAPRVLRHDAARLTFDPTLVMPFDDDQDRDEQGWLTRMLGGHLNVRYLAVALVGGMVLYQSALALLGLSGVAVALAVLPAVVAGTEARAGTADFEPAPVHFSQAGAVLATERAVLEQSKTIEAAEERAAAAETETWREARERVGELGRTVTERLNEGSLGISSTDLPARNGTDPDGDDEGAAEADSDGPEGVTYDE